ncbi:MAG: NADH-quinone oxidoreductase subunit N [Deltaproteobacteria bacterium]|nr:NADH-quinone oxidoreductase subunit N [Deltaproteobacteria bacterium]
MMAEALSKLRNEARESPSSSLAMGSAVVLASGGVASLALWLQGPDNLMEARAALAPWLLIDRFSLFFFVILTLGAFLTVLLAGGYLPEHKLDRGEFYPLVLLSTAGAMALAAAGDLLTMFIGLEVMSLGVYAMVAFRRGSPRSVEAAMKYFLLGSFAAALLLYGGALLYGATGKTDFSSISFQLAHTGYANPTNLQQLAWENSTPLMVIGLILVVIGLAFKISAVPFHMWTPDAYEGAPTPATTFMAGAVKAGAFAMMIRVLMMAFGDVRSASWGSGWPPVLAALAVATMTVGNLIAGRQESVKRMLAYSSITHAGYMLVGVVAMAGTARAEANGAVLFYTLIYTISTVGAFGALILCGSRGAEAVSYEDLAGLGKRNPAVALALSLFIFSLAGIPPTAGFFAKLYLFKAAVSGDYIVLTVIALINTVIGAYYYLRVLVFMYFREPLPGAPIAKPMKSGHVAIALVFAALLVLALGILPSKTLQAALSSTISG